jgi:hypothetical protein
MGRMATTTREKKSVCMCVCEGETGDQNKDAKPKGVRDRASSCSSNRRKREGNPDDLKAENLMRLPKILYR